MDRRHFVSVACAALSGAGGTLLRPDHATANAPTNGIRAVLELFTSQGCSSCPAADALFEQYTHRKDLVALTLPVDYWDYLGWRDTLASSKFTKRQRAYAKHRGDGQIYTPQLVVNGATHTNGADSKSVNAAMAKALAAPPSWVPVTVATDNTHLRVDVAAISATVAERPQVTIWAASIARRINVEVKRGENAGKTLSYFNVVRDVHALGTWTGDTMNVRVAREAMTQRGEDCCAILLQAGMAGPIFGAAMLQQL